MYFNKILIANRGEIAVRIIRAARELGIGSVAVYSDPDKSALHVKYADESYPLNGISAADTYLNIPKLLEIAKISGAEAVHPGYGFLSERAHFITAVEDAGLVFIGPSANSVEMVGSKTGARQIMKQNGVPFVPGTKIGRASCRERV